MTSPSKLHFISGLPRSGSTLLAAILRQNPRFEAGMSSGLGVLVSSNIAMMGAGTELSHLIKSEQRPTILRALFDAYYAECNRQVVFDTNRGWCGRMPLLADLYPSSKVIACVRDVPWILDSIERLIRQDPYERTALFNAENGASVYARVEALAQQNHMVGRPWTWLKEAFYGDQAKNLLVVDYEFLARQPEAVLKLIYEFVGEDWYPNHDFKNVEYQADEFDAALGVKGLHRVRKEVRFEPRRTLLPPDLFKKFEGMNFWHDVTGSAASVIAPKKSDLDLAAAG